MENQLAIFIGICGGVALCILLFGCATGILAAIYIGLLGKINDSDKPPRR